MRRTRRTRPAYMPASDWFHPDSLAVVQGMVKSALYASSDPKRFTVVAYEPETKTPEETE